LPRWRARRAGGSHEESRGLVADGAMRPVFAVVATPILQLFVGIDKGQDVIRRRVSAPIGAIKH